MSRCTMERSGLGSRPAPLRNHDPFLNPFPWGLLTSISCLEVAHKMHSMRLWCRYGSIYKSLSWNDNLTPTSGRNQHRWITKLILPKWEAADRCPVLLMSLVGFHREHLPVPCFRAIIADCSRLCRAVTKQATGASAMC